MIVETSRVLKKFWRHVIILVSGRFFAHFYLDDLFQPRVIAILDSIVFKNTYIFTSLDEYFNLQKPNYWNWLSLRKIPDFKWYCWAWLLWNIVIKFKFISLYFWYSLIRWMRPNRSKPFLFPLIRKYDKKILELHYRALFIVYDMNVQRTNLRVSPTDCFPILAFHISCFIQQFNVPSFISLLFFICCVCL